MQTENLYRKEEANLKRGDELTGTREHVKFAGKVEGEEEHAGSQPSTIQSLNEVPDRETPSSATGSLGQIKESIKEGVSNIQGDIKQKTDQFKGKITEKFGEEIQPEKDLAPEMKEQLKEVNEEIKYHSHGEEKVVEGQGHARSQPSGTSFGSKDILNKASDKIDEFKDRAHEQGQQLKGKMTEVFGEQISPEKDLDRSAKEHVKEINEEIRHHPHGEERVVEGQGHARVQPQKSKETQEIKGQGESELPDLRFAPKEVVNQAIDKFEEVRDKVAHKGEELKQGVRDVSQQIPSGQHDQAGAVHEGHEHHHLSAESPSFVPTKQSHQLYEVVKEGLVESVPLTEKVEEFEHEKQQTSSQFQKKDQPASEQIKQGAQEASNKLSEKVEEVKQDISQKKDEIVDERKPLVDKIMGRIHEVTDNFHQRVEEVKSAFKVEEIPADSDRKPLLDVVQEGISKIAHNIEAVKSKVVPTKQEGQVIEQTTEFQQEQTQVPETSHTLKERITEGIHNITSKITENVEHLKERFSSGKEVTEQ